LLIKSGRRLLRSDWHQPPCVDIAIAGDTIVGIAVLIRWQPFAIGDHRSLTTASE